MSVQISSYKITSPFDIESAFSKALVRLNVSNAKVSIGDSTYPIDSVTHQSVFLPKIALRAEELSVLIFGVRLFPGIVYTIKKKSASGFQIQDVDSLTPEQKEDPNFVATQSIPAASQETLTAGLEGLLLELSIAECFDIDPENNLLVSKTIEMEVHKAFKITENYQEGQCLPLLTSEYLSANELQVMARQEGPIRALNKARRIADDLAMERLSRRERERDETMDRGA